MGRLFGTDGIRGIAGEVLTKELALRVGFAAAAVLREGKDKNPLIIIGKDTRVSSDMLEDALTEGLIRAGAEVMQLGVISTPAVAFTTVDLRADAGIVISASHNSYEYNGIKIFNAEGYKLSDELEAKIEDFVLSETVIPEEVTGRLLPCGAECRRYIEHLAETVDDISGIKIAVDCANGAASSTARELFESVGIHADIINAAPNGVNINEKCGSTYLDGLKAVVAAGDYDFGVAFDGDADRCLIVDELGNELDGDKYLAICGASLKEQGKLSGNTVVATVMSNVGLHIFAREREIGLVCTNVGDRNVLEKMLELGAGLGGEQSGHIIFLEHATTGDGQLAALQFAKTVKSSGKKVSQLSETMQTYPQVLINVKIDGGNEAKNRVMNDPGLMSAVANAEKELGSNGRVLVRPSGTEALLRVMVEAKEAECAQKCAEFLAKTIKNIEF